MGETLALLSALCFGIADYAGGILSRRASATAVALVGQLSGLVLMVVLAVVVPASHVDGASLAWGALSGIGTGVGVMFLYRGMAHGQMSVVVPLSVVGGVAIPVVVGVALLSDRPSTLAWVGIVIAMPALWLITRNDRKADTETAGGTVDGLIAGAGFALQNIVFVQIAAEAGFWPLVLGRLVSTLTIFFSRKLVPTPTRLPRKLILPAALTGLVAASAIMLYALAVQRQLLAVAVVLSSLYPVIPVLLGITVLREKLGVRQIIGLFGAGLAVVFLAWN